MIILTIRTDNPMAEIGIYSDLHALKSIKWQAHRILAESIHDKLKKLLDLNKLELKQVQAIVVYKGPGSFTGLRIGISVANALKYSLDIPIIGTNGDDWINSGLKLLNDNKNDVSVVPVYGAPINITKQKK